MNFFEQVMVILYLIVAVVAVFGVFLTYFDRPIRLEIVKRHSDDLKGLVQIWMQEVPKIPFASEFGMYESVSEPSSLEIPVERRYLFNDIKNHAPAGLRLFKVWNAFKLLYDDYEEMLYSLFKAIGDEATERTGLPLGWDKKGELFEPYIKLIYYDAFNVAKNIPKQYDKTGYRTTGGQEYVLASNAYTSSLAWPGSSEALQNVQDVHQDMINRLEDSEYPKMAKDILESQKNMEEARETLMRTLNGFTSIPILPGKCDYIRRSIYGILYR